MAAQNVSDILGCPLDMAQGLLEAAGGDEAMAIELGLGGGMMGDGMDSAPPPAASLPYAHWNAIWPETTIPSSWQDQKLNVTTTDGGIIQERNGPCGVLSVVQGELWMQQPPPATLEDGITASVQTILTRIMEQHQQSQVTLANGSTRSVQDAAKEIRTAVVLVEAAASTAGASNLRSTSAIDTSSTLVEGPHWLCSSDLMCLLLRGKVGSGNFGAWDPDTKKKWSFYPTTAAQQKLGLLSMMEIQEGIQVADDLKFDKQVWVLHTGDHFMTMKMVDNNKLQVYDGLKPLGPRQQTFQLSGDLSLATPAEDVHHESFKKKRPGQPDDIVQAKKTDSDHYKDWSFEVVPAVDDPSVQGPLDDDPNEPVYNFETLAVDTNSSWRCASCYNTRFQTMNFGINESGDTCGACGKTRSQAFWSLWQSYEEMSPRMKRRARHMYAPKVELVISTLYPKAEIEEVE